MRASAAAGRGRRISGGFWAFLLVLVLGGLILAWTPVVGAQATDDDTGDYLVEIAPSASDNALWNVVRQSLSSFSAEAVEASAGESEQLAEVAGNYAALSSSLSASSSSSSWFLLTRVSAAMVRSFEQGNLPQSVLFSMAGGVEPLTGAAAAKLTVSVVTVTRSMADSDIVLDQIQALEDSAAALGELDQATVQGTLKKDTLQDLSDDELQSLADTPQSPLASAAQLELDQRTAKSLPDLSSYANGKLPGAELCEIPWATSERLLCAAMDNFTRLNEAYKAEFGKNLPILDGYRPLSEQEYVHATDPNWTAVPGTSNHGWGLAVDFDWDVFKEWDDPEVVWMIANGPQFGWRLPTALGPKSTRPEPWHYEFGTSYTGDDAADFQGPLPAVVYRFTLP